MIKVLNKKAIIAFLLSLSLVSCGTQQGERGPVGPQGEQGETGPQGPAGQDGVSVISIDKTSSDGLVDTYTIFYSDGTSSSFNITNGRDGEQGIQGNPGQDGHNPVISIGANGNWFVDGADTGIKAQGPKGDQGDQGPAGKDGTSVLTGNGSPSNTLGSNGDSYIDLYTWNYYVKENNSWVLKGNIKGNNGDNGQDAITYVPCIFNNYDGTKLYEFYYEKGSDIVYDGPEPLREEDEYNMYYFSGWDKSLSNIQQPTIFTAQYETVDKADLGMVPSINSDASTLTYGLYPQQRINNVELINELESIDETSINGWYKYENSYYCKSVASPCFDTATFADGTTIVAGQAYWYKCDTISWNILKTNENDYLVLSSKLIDARPYFDFLAIGSYYSKTRTINGKGIYYSNYQFSDCSAWLNGYNGTSYDVEDYTDKGFLNTAFALDKTYIIDTLVDNSRETTNNAQSIYCCDNRHDKVFLLSYKDYCNVDYGFPNAGAGLQSRTLRACEITDYAKAQGGYYSPSTNTGQYWTRSPSSNYNPEAHVSMVDVDGFLGNWINAGYSGFNGNVSDGRGSIRPAITIRIPE